MHYSFIISQFALIYREIDHQTPKSYTIHFKKYPMILTVSDSDLAMIALWLSLTNRLQAAPAACWLQAIGARLCLWACRLLHGARISQITLAATCNSHKQATSAVYLGQGNVTVAQKFRFGTDDHVRKVIGRQSEGSLIRGFNYPRVR